MRKAVTDGGLQELNAMGERLYVFVTARDFPKEETQFPNSHGPAVPGFVRLKAPIQCPYAKMLHLPEHLKPCLKEGHPVWPLAKVGWS